MARLVAFRMLSSSTAAASQEQTATKSARSTMRSNRASLVFGESFLLSSTPSISSSSGRERAAANTGPAKGPRPTSSTPTKVRPYAPASFRSYSIKAEPMLFPPRLRPSERPPAGSGKPFRTDKASLRRCVRTACSFAAHKTTQIICRPLRWSPEQRSSPAPGTPPLRKSKTGGRKSSPPKQIKGPARQTGQKPPQSRGALFQAGP